ncbi:MAG: DUF4307 domain-containing protein [Propionicimonas sp.]|uniref:DUF4307 domain-containing protein n=1 Tax=Propionicimonas sp. TaxID=1955623 RepID=UPI003D0CFB8F
MTDTEAAARLARRYPAPRRRWWILVAIVLSVVGLAWLVVSGGHWATQVPTARVDAFDVRSDTLIHVTVTVDRPDPNRGAECALSAQAVTYDTVGELTVSVPPGGTGLTQLEVDLKTFKRATTAVVDSCQWTG